MIDLLEYEWLTPENIYDVLLKEKVYIRPGMDCYAEFSEGVGRQKHLLTATINYLALTLDEWAGKFSMSVSTLIELVGRATYKKEREYENVQL